MKRKILAVICGWVAGVTIGVLIDYLWVSDNFSLVKSIISNGTTLFIVFAIILLFRKKFS